uniref:FAM192A_Fyv6_N domain-containing protein n=2 Tax=Caenorhabditis japonica TaxID=281687 RepID=A0A8R1DXG9_CAEJA
MTSGFVTTKELGDEKQARQEAWEKARKPTDATLAPEPEYCNKTLFDQLKDNKDAKQLEIDEAKKLKNMVRGIDEDESVFLSDLDTSKRVVKMQMKKEEQEVIKEMVVTQTLAAKQQLDQKFALKPSTSTGVAPPKSKQAAFLSTAIKRKSTSAAPEDKKEDVPAKIPKPDEPTIQKIGALQALCDYAPSSDSEGSDSDDSDDVETLPILVTSKPEKKPAGGGCE